MVDGHDLNCSMDHTKATVSALLDERRDLLAAVSDLLAFQVEAMHVISSVAWPNGSARQVEGLVEQYRRPTPAIAKVRGAALATVTPEQRELPLISAR